MVPTSVPIGTRRSPRVAGEAPIDGMAALSDITNATLQDVPFTIPFVYTYYTNASGYESELNAVSELRSCLAERRQLRELMDY